jgi:hypothetical protein
MKKTIAVLAAVISLAGTATAQAADRNPFKWNKTEAARTTRDEGNVRCFALARLLRNTVCVGSRGIPVILPTCQIHNDNAWFPASYATCRMQFGLVRNHKARLTGCTLRLEKHALLRNGMHISVTKRCIPGTVFG